MPKTWRILFELELDKLRNQYETVERGEKQSASNQIDEALQRLQELARRQQQENERMKRRAGNPQGGGRGGGQQRELAEETEELARKLEKLAREQSQPDLMDTARRLREAAEAMRRGTSSGKQGNVAEGIAALDELKDARRLLEKNREVRLESDIQDAIDSSPTSGFTAGKGVVGGPQARPRGRCWPSRETRPVARAQR